MGCAVCLVQIGMPQGAAEVLAGQATSSIFSNKIQS